MELRDQNLTASQFTNLVLAQSRFQDIDLSNAAFDDINLAQTTFQNVNLSGVQITDANLDGMTIEGHAIQPLLPTDKQIQHMAPVLLVADLQAALKEYEDVFGFSLDFTFGDPVGYAGVSREAARFHLRRTDSAVPQPRNAALDTADFYLFVQDVNALFKELSERGASVVHPLRDQDYGIRDFFVRDSHGYLLAFGQILGGEEQ